MYNQAMLLKTIYLYEQATRICVCLPWQKLKKGVQLMEVTILGRVEGNQTIIIYQPSAQQQNVIIYRECPEYDHCLNRPKMTSCWWIL